MHSSVTSNGRLATTMMTIMKKKIMMIMIANLKIESAKSEAADDDGPCGEEHY